MAKEGRSFSLLGNLPLCLFGFACIRAWDDVAFTRYASLFPERGWMGEDLFLIVMVVVFAPLALFARRVAPLHGKAWPVPVATTMLMASVACDAATPMAPAAAPLLVGTSVIFAGAGAALSILLWAELQSCFDPFYVILYVSGSFLLGGIAGWLVVGMGAAQGVFVKLLLPLLSAICLRRGYDYVPKEDLPKRTWGPMRFPWGLVVVLGVYQFVFGLHHAVDIASVNPSVWGTVAASAMLFFGTLLLSRRLDVAFVYRTPFVLMVCGLLITLLTFSASNVVASLFISTAYTLMFLVLTIVLCDISHRYGISVLVLCGIQEVVTVTIVGGDLVSDAMDAGAIPLAMSDTTVVVGLTILVVVATVALLFERSSSRDWGLAFFGADKATIGVGEDRHSLRCNEIADRCRLSPREREVFLKLTGEGSFSSIAEELCIAPGTLKSHSRRIYQKLGVHSRKEMLDLVDHAPRSVDENH